MNIILLTTELFIALFHMPISSMSLPVETEYLPWSHPCHAENSPMTSWTGATTSVSALIHPEPNITELIEELYARSKEAQQLAKELKDKIVYNRFHSSASVLNYMSEKHLDGFPKREDVIPWQNEHDTENVVRRDFINLSKIVVFMEQIFTDASTDGNTELINDVTVLKNGVYSILCQLDTIIASLHTSIDNHVTRCVMADNLRDEPSIAERSKRDFIIFKDAVNVLTENCVNYAKMNR